MPPFTARMTNNDGRLSYTVRDLCQQTGLAERTIRRWIADGRLDVVRVGRSVLVTAESAHRVFGIEP
jgi:excisionase family DNA binding protein